MRTRQFVILSWLLAYGVLINADANSTKEDGQDTPPPEIVQWKRDSLTDNRAAVRAFVEDLMRDDHQPPGPGAKPVGEPKPIP